MNDFSIPKKLKFSTKDSSGNQKELGTMEWDGDKWFISGRCKDGIKGIIGERGLYFGGKILTVRDRALFLPLLRGYSGLIVDVTEYDE